MRKTLLFIGSALLLSGCVHHIPVTSQTPTAVPERIVVKPASRSGSSSQKAMTAEDDLRAYCLVMKNTSPEVDLLSAITDESVRTRIRTVLSIPEEKAETTAIGRRCVNEKLRVCDLTKSPNCLEKVNYEVKANAAMQDACADPDSDGAVLPPSVTGEDTAFLWQCQDGKPVITGQLRKSDEQGYDPEQWFEL